jgi:Ca2+-binding EF-hand superfamily protein
METTLSTLALAVATLLAGNAMAGDPAADGPRGIMRADTNGDGKISKEEAAALHDKLQGGWFDKTDLDKDGFVSQDELRQARDTRQGGRHEEMKARMEQRFKEADANGDGQISLDEAQAKMPRLAERFSTLDSDKNGLLSKDEMRNGAKGGRAKPQS